MRPLALSQGDPSGIGPEIALMAYSRRAALGLPPFILFADADVMRARVKALALDIPIVETDCAGAASVFARALPIAPLNARARGVPGAPDASDAPVTIEAITRAVEAVFAGEAAAVVTNPIAKNVLYQAGFRHPGHTEFLADLAARQTGRAVRPVMMIWSEQLAVVPATIHIPLSAAPQALTRALLVETGVIVARDLSARFGLARPRLAFSGLNPHAGEGGTMGREEIEVIAPAIEDLRALGIAAFGPLPADTMFHPAARATYDVAICMTHDQALIPVKTLAFDTGVNVTLGLPFVRTSPDHGTAFDIAGAGRANPSSLIEALRLAARLAGSA